MVLMSTASSSPIIINYFVHRSGSYSNFYLHFLNSYFALMWILNTVLPSCAHSFSVARRYDFESFKLKCMCLVSSIIFCLMFCFSCVLFLGRKPRTHVRYVGGERCVGRQRPQWPAAVLSNRQRRLHWVSPPKLCRLEGCDPGTGRPPTTTHHSNKSTEERKAGPGGVSACVQCPDEANGVSPAVLTRRVCFWSPGVSAGGGGTWMVFATDGSSFRLLSRTC